ncbi:hypothetical protein D6D19_00395 [Aureobasidium pullulans]|uniref:Uncharacterized protein n=1 Tax=Aureobasidium pullulans TaxID=5580 RepID=A0A4S8SQA8_AURPU|nr:hypothetical protein D6D28_03506 [Aureobasidium pullulans]THW80462.1 hypothetical protein D6D19_00395 [Aureobasidium pullulans]THY32141.1 hypothetical protein D6D00_01759 [Aureobasidium pullulans]
MTSGGLHNNIFRPPRTPGMSHLDTMGFAATPSQDKPALTRKRSRANSNKANTSAPLSYPSRDAWTSQAMSPAPLANELYTLDYKFDTPTLAAASRHDDFAGERDFRWKWDTSDLSPEQEVAYMPGLLSRERNGKGRTVSYTSMASASDGAEPRGWGGFAMKLVGGVVGKVWHFCREKAFSGFYAGAGQGYGFAHATQLPTPLPGQYPSNDFFGDFEQDNTPERSNKRQHTESGWVMVDSNPDAPRPSNRKTSSEDLTHLGATRASSRRALSSVTRRGPSRQTSYTGSPQAQSRLDVFSQAFTDHSTSTSTASTASTRSTAPFRPAVGIHRSPVASPIRTSFGPDRRASLASSANGETLSPDAQRFLHRKERQERDVDKSMRKMSRQIEDLIRQGQVALGTKFEVESDDTDYADDNDDWEDARR